jgi:hypothetical protein
MELRTHIAQQGCRLSAQNGDEPRDCFCYAKNLVLATLELLKHHAR